MLYKSLALAGLALTSAAPVALEEETLINEQNAHGRELFPLYAMGAKCARLAEVHNAVSQRRGCSAAAPPVMSLGQGEGVKGPIKALEMLSLNDNLKTVVESDSMCTRRNAMARAAGLAAGLALASVNAPGFAAETKTVKMGADNGQLVFVPAELKICKGDSVTWVNNKAGPHNVVFDEDDIPDGVSQESISMDDQLGEEGQTYTKKFDVAGQYGYYCEPHRGAGMTASMTVG